MRATPIVLLAVVSIAVIAVPGCTPEEPEEGFGRFEGRLVWIDEGLETKRLAEDFAYVDPHGRRWVAPKGFPSDGATIPRWMLSLTGGRFEGARLHAAVIHDVYCEEAYRKGVRWQDVHRMFYYACRCRGVDETMAKILYAAVLLGGPRWDASTGVEERWWIRCIPGFLRGEPDGSKDCSREDARDGARDGVRDGVRDGALDQALDDDACDEAEICPQAVGLAERALELSAWIQADAPDLDTIEARAAP
jgi:hypothetical protein